MVHACEKPAQSFFRRRSQVRANNPHFGNDTVTDFNVGQDVITFDHTLFANATPLQVLSQTHDTAAGAVILVDRAETIALDFLDRPEGDRPA